MLETKESEYGLEFYYNGKYIGIVKGESYITHRRYEHYFRKFEGFGLSTEVVDELNERGVREVIIIYRNKDGSEALLRSEMWQWQFQSIVWVDKSEGFEDEQVILPVKFMEVKGELKDLNRLQSW